MWECVSISFYICNSWLQTHRPDCTKVILVLELKQKVTVNLGTKVESSEMKVGTNLGGKVAAKTHVL